MKKRNVFISLFVLIFSFLLVGCEQKISVENIYFEAPSADGIVLLVGESYSPEVYFSPRYPTNQGYKIVSGNETIIASRNNQLTALTAGKTYVKVVADENELIQDVMLVQVVASRTKLSTPTIAYSSEKQSFTISSASQDGFINGYTIDINGESIAIGNVLEYSLADYNKHLQSSTSTAGISAYDRDLTVKVKATVPSYTNAFEDSNFSQEIKINQASAPKAISVAGGLLKIEKSKAINYSIFVNDNLIGQTNQTSFDLSVVDKSFAGKSVKVSVQAIGNGGTGFITYNSAILDVNVKCVADLQLSMLNETVSWNSVSEAKGYSIFIDGQTSPITTVETSYLDIKSLQNFDSLFADTTTHKLNVKVVLAENATNTIQSANQTAEIAVARLATPEIECINNIVRWNAVDGAKTYQVRVFDQQDDIIMNLATSNCFVDMSTDEFISNASYKIVVTANFVEGETYYLASKQAEYNVEKVAMVEAEIIDYNLTFASEIDNEYEIEILDKSNQLVYSYTYPALTTQFSLNLLDLGIVYQAGKYTVNVKHFGNGADKLDSEKFILPFVQLDDVDAISMANGIISASAGEFNIDNGAVLRFDLFKDGTMVDSLQQTDDLNELNLVAGDYQVKLYVIGDKSTTFSVLDSEKQEKVCATYDIKVLAVPTITTQHAIAQFTINEVANAVDYQVIENNVPETVNSLIYTFDLRAEESRIFALKAVGDGTTTLDSQTSKDYTFTRLQTPELTFNNLNNSLSTNLTGSNYILKLNDADITASYEFGTSVSGLVAGNNRFELVTTAQDDVEVTFINSLPCTIDVVKTNAETSFAIQGSNLLVTPLNPDNNTTLEIQISSTVGTVIFNENNYNETNPLLDVKKLGNSYSITLLDDKYNPLLLAMDNGFEVKVRYIANHNQTGADNSATSDYSHSVEINFAPKASFNMVARDGQNVCFNISAGYNYNDYLIIINNTYIQEFDESVVVDSEAQQIKFDISYIYDKVDADILQDINEIKLISLNNKSNETNLLLSSIGDKILVKKANTITLVGAKNNSTEFANNSVTISFAENATVYERSMLIKVFNDLDSEDKFAISNIYPTPNLMASIEYSFNLDDFGKNLTGTKSIVAYVKACSSYSYVDGHGETQKVYVFDSPISNRLDYNIVENTSVTTDGAKLIFSLPENVDGIDVYKKNGSELTKLNTNLVLNSYDLGINDGSMILVVKAISTTIGNYTNSQLSQEIVLTKLATPAVGIENGMVVLTLDNKSAELFESTTDFNQDNLQGCVVRFTHTDVEGFKYIYNGIEGVKLSGKDLIIEPSILLKYGVTALTKETIKFDILANAETGEIYLYSNKATVDLYGLFAPTKVSLPSANDPSTVKVQTLTWTDTLLNKLTDGTDVLAGYVLKVVDFNGVEHYSNKDLVYLEFDAEQDEYVATDYPTIITTNSIAFPYGYRGENGDVVEFETGSYFVSVKSMPKADISGYNLCCSTYSDSCEVVLLETPMPNLNAGVIEWQKIYGATEYVLTLEDIDDSSVKHNIVLSTNKFEFEGFDGYVGNYKITVKAVSNLNNIVNSLISESICVHRLPDYVKVDVEDGVLLMEANGLFVQAKLNFYNTSTGITETLTFDNDKYQNNIDNLKDSGLTSWAGSNIEDLNQTKTYSIVIDKEYLLKLSKGNYTLSIKLLGNTRNDFGLVSSTTKQETTINNFVKLAFDEEKQNAEDKTWIRVDERGVFTFACPEEYALGGLNYEFNQKVNEVDYTFYKNTVIYKLIVKINNNSYEMFAIDYASYVANKSLLDADLITEFSDIDSLYAVVKYPYLNSSETKYLYFNVFKNNQINFNLDNFCYYNTTISTTDGVVSLASALNPEIEAGYYDISLVEGGVFSIDLHLLGCDITEVVDESTGNTIKQAYLSSDLYSSKSFIRYTDNNLKSYISYTYTENDANNSGEISTSSAENILEEGTPENQQNLTFTYSGDLIFQNKLKRDDNGQVLDYPVYQLEINPIVYYDGGATETQPYIYYLYHDVASVDQVIENNPISNFVEKQKYEVKYLEHNDDYLLFEFSKYFVPGNYSIKIRTLAGVGSDNLNSKYLLNSRVPSTSYPFKRLSNTYLQVKDGKLQFELAYVLNDKVKSYITDYEFVVYDNNGGSTQEYNFKINQYSQGVSILDNVLTYVLPEKVSANKVVGDTTETVELALSNGTLFGIKVRAIQTQDGDSGILNSTFEKSVDGDKITNISKSQGIETVDIKNGVIVWKVIDETNYNGTIIRFEFEDGKVVEETITKDRSLKKVIEGVTYYYYEISDSEYTCIDGVGKSKINAGAYTLKLLTKGKTDIANNVEILNSNYTEPFEMNRLSKVDVSNIVSKDGTLNWEHAESEHISYYIVTLTGEKTYTFTTDENQIDFIVTADDNGKMLEVGVYSITIKAIGSNFISSMQSNEATGFAKLGNITQLTETDNFVSWQAVANAQGYKVTFVWSSNGVEATSSETILATEELKCFAPPEMIGSYTITVQAVGVDTGKAFNGEIFTFTGSSERPQPVGEIRFDESDLCLYIPIAEDFKSNDKLRISYNIAKYSFSGGTSSLGSSTLEVAEITNGDAEYMRVIDETTYYVYPLVTAGKYTDLSVSVVRKDSLTSVATPYADIDFNYFATGDGTDNPYGIANATHLLNIALKPNKNYVFLQAINMTNVDITSQINSYGAIIADTFTGSLDGQNYSLFGLSNVVASNVAISNYFGLALFKQITNATIKNLNIAETDNNPTKFVNMFAQQQSNVLKSSLIAMSSTDSTLVDVSVVDFNLVIQGNYALVNNAYLAGLVADAINTTFEGCIVNLNVDFVADFVSTSGNVYVGGITAYAKGCKIISSSARATSVALSVNQTYNNRRFKSIGGVAGYMSNNGSTTAEVSNVTSTISQTTNIYADNFGGLIGDAINVQFTDCTVLGAFNHTGLETTNLGGLVGQMQAGTLSHCAIKLEFNLTISNYNKLYVGFVAGYVTTNNGVMAIISNCQINQTFTNKTQFSEDYTTISTMGIYGGSSQNNYNPTGCTKID